MIECRESNELSSHTQRRPTIASVSNQASHTISPLKLDNMITQHSQHSTSPIRVHSRGRVGPQSLAVVSGFKNIDQEFKKLSLQSPTLCLPPRAPELNKFTNSPNKKLTDRFDDRLSEFSLLTYNQPSQEDRFKQDQNNLQFKQIKFNKHRNSDQEFRTQQTRLSVRDENIPHSITQSQHTTKNGSISIDWQGRYERLKEEYDMLRKYLQEKELLIQELQFKQIKNEGNDQQSKIIKQLSDKLLENQEKLQQYSVVQFEIQSLKQQKTEVEMKLNRTLNENQQLKNDLQQQQQSLQNYRSQVTQVKELELMVEVCQNDQDGFIKSLESKDAEIQYLKNRLNVSQEQLLKLKQDNIKLFNELQFLQNEVKSMQQSIIQSQEISLQNQQLKLDNENQELNKKSLQEQYSNLIEQYKRQSSIIDTLKQQCKLADTEVQEIQSQNSILQNTVNQQQLTLDEQQIQLEQYKDEITQNTQKISELTQYYQTQFQHLQTSLDNWFRQQIEIEIKKVVEPINEEKDYFQEKLSQQEQKNDQLELQNQELIQQYEQLNQQHHQLRILFEQIRTISQTNI